MVFHIRRLLIFIYEIAHKNIKNYVWNGSLQNNEELKEMPAQLLYRHFGGASINSPNGANYPRQRYRCDSVFFQINDVKCARAFALVDKLCNIIAVICRLKTQAS